MFAIAITSVACTEVPRTYSTRAGTGKVIFRDDFERSELGDAWLPSASSDSATIDAGVLKVQGIRNHPLWLDLALPDNVRIEFDAWATSDEADVKFEMFGDGKSFATRDNYIATGYVLIFGGWNNTLSAIVRKNEHGRERETIAEPKVLPDQRYHFVITRSAGQLLWEVNGKELLTYDDAHPLRGPGHDRFAFSGWDAEVHFDNLVIEALD